MEPEMGCLRVIGDRRVLRPCRVFLYGWISPLGLGGSFQAPPCPATAVSPPLPPPVRHTYFQDGETTQKHAGAEAPVPAVSRAVLPGGYLMPLLCWFSFSLLPLRFISTDNM